MPRAVLFIQMRVERSNSSQPALPRVPLSRGKCSQQKGSFKTGFPGIMIFIAAFDGRRLPGNKAYANPKSINLAPAHGVSVFYEAPSRKETVAIKAIPV